MKYIFQNVPDPDGDGFFRKFLKATSTIIPANEFYLEIDYDLCAPRETWTLIHYYDQVSNGVKSRGDYKQQVYHGKELSGEQIDLMVELVLGLEEGYLNFGEFIAK